MQGMLLRPEVLAVGKQHPVVLSAAGSRSLARLHPPPPKVHCVSLAWQLCPLNKQIWSWDQISPSLELWMTDFTPLGASENRATALEAVSGVNQQSTCSHWGKCSSTAPRLAPPPVGSPPSASGDPYPVHPSSSPAACLELGSKERTI